MENLKRGFWVIVFLILLVNITSAAGKINLKEYPANSGTAYRVPRDERYKLLEKGKLFIWKENESGKGNYVNPAAIKDEKGNKVDIKKYIDIYAVDLNGDKVKELFLLPAMYPIYEENEAYSDEWYYDIYNYRATILQKSNQGYKPLKVASIGGDYSYVIDVRDLNKDGLPDFLLGTGAGASSYNDIVEMFYYDKGTIKSQVFEQWVRLYDFNSDGIYELVVSYPGGTNSAHAYWAPWLDIWEWKNKKYVMTDDKYPEYYEKIYIPQQIERMIEYADMASAVTDRVPLIEKAWKIVIKSGLYKIKDKEKGKIENKKGIDSLNKGNTEEALKHFKKAAEFSPGDPEFVNNTGYAYELLEAYETAMEWYFKTLASDPSRAVAWYNLGCCKAIKGKKEEATGCFYNYIRFAPHEGEAKKAIKELSLKDKSKAVREAAKAAYEGYNSEM